MEGWRLLPLSDENGGEPLEAWLGKRKVQSLISPSHRMLRAGLLGVCKTDDELVRFRWRRILSPPWQIRSALQQDIKHGGINCAQSQQNDSTTVELQLSKLIGT